MNRTTTALVVAALVLTGCSTVRESRFNPFNWFGRSTSAPVVTGDEEVNPLIPQGRRITFQIGSRAPEVGPSRAIGEISELLVERRPGGAVIRATGIADRMGPYEVILRKIDDESVDGVLVYEMRHTLAPGPSGGSEWARSVTVATALSDNDLAGIRTIRVKGARNVRSVRR